MKKDTLERFKNDQTFRSLIDHLKEDHNNVQHIYNTTLDDHRYHQGQLKKSKEILNLIIEAIQTGDNPV